MIIISRLKIIISRVILRLFLGACGASFGYHISNLDPLPSLPHVGFWHHSTSKNFNLAFLFAFDGF
jgi:hypothetical protein